MRGQRRITQQGSVRSDEKGFILISTLILMMALVVIVGAFIVLVSYDMKSTGFQVDNAKAFYVAEAGLNKAIWYLTNTAPDSSVDGSWRTDPYPAVAGPDSTDPQYETFSDGGYTIWVETDGSDALITSQGEVNNIQRVLQQTVTISGGNATSVANSWREAS